MASDQQYRELEPKQAGIRPGINLNKRIRAYRQIWVMGLQVRVIGLKKTRHTPRRRRLLVE
jgi:hypothetical protein